MLPRGRGTAIIPRRRVAPMPSAVVPGFTRVLAIPAEPDPPLFRYLSHHQRRFYSRWVSDSQRPSGLSHPPIQPRRTGRRSFKQSSGNVDRQADGSGVGKRQWRRAVP
jgi:hypothetical protein